MTLELSKLRSEWEKGGTSLLVHTQEVDDATILFVVLERNNKYFLYRYVKFLSKWDISVELSEQDNLDEIFLKLNKNFEEMYPR